MSLLKNLRHIREHGPSVRTWGICSNLWALPSHSKADEHQLAALMQQWPEYSGHAAYPVPSMDAFTSHITAYYDNMHEGWNPDHPYGAARLRLLDFIIAELEKDA